MVMQSLARRANLSGFVADGDYGRILGPLDDRCVLRGYAEHGTWARAANEMLAEFLKNGGTYIDIGANIGLTTIPIAARATVVCHAFEPVPEAFRFLEANVSHNCAHGNVRLYRQALLDKKATVDFEVSPSNIGDNRWRVTRERGALGEQAWRSTQVQAVRLDDVGIEVSEPLAAKMDTQGAEPFAIAGGRGVLGRAGLLVMEFWPYGITRMGGDPTEVYRFLQSNFSWARVSVGDAEAYGSWQPISEVLSSLELTFDTDRRNQHRYLDIIAAKAGTIEGIR